jgi:hypothetical protein
VDGLSPEKCHCLCLSYIKCAFTISWFGRLNFSENCTSTKFSDIT